jgi:glycosyltransferase involved in cell wall biosynthesis
MLSKMNIIWVTGSHDSSERLKRVLNLLPSRLLVIPNGCPAPSCKCGLGTRTSEESENSNRVVALSVGHLERRKGHAVLVEALALLKNSGSLGREWLFRIEGEGAEYLSLQRRIKNEGLEGVVQLIGKAFCVYHEFLNSDVLIHPSISNEDLPNVISEAMAMKIPAIGTRVAGIPEQIDDGKTGFLVMPGSTVELAHAVKTIMSDPVLRLNMSSQARERYLQLFSPVQAEARYLELYGVEGVKPH